MTPLRFVSTLLLSFALPVIASAQQASLYSFVLGSHAPIVNEAVASTSYSTQSEEARSQGFRPLTANWGSADEHALKLIVWQPSADCENTRNFLDALMTEKHNLMKLYGLRNETYNRLAAIAFGIYGVETKFGRSLRYDFKEDFPEIVATVKHLEHRTDSDSRGGTQIKKIPALIQKAYPNITPETLYVPQNSAIATLGFLVDTLKQLRARTKLQSLSYINDENIYDYILYIYSGQPEKLFLEPGGAPVTDSRYIVGVHDRLQALSVWEN